MPTTPAVGRLDVQILSDIRLMAMSLEKLSDNSASKLHVRRACSQIIAECERLIEVGPPELRHIIERTASRDAIEQQLRSGRYSITRRTEP